MMEELLVHSYVVQNAGGEALVQNTDELVKVPRVHDTAPQPSRGDRQDDSSDRLAQVVCCLSLWALCIHIVEDTRLGPALRMEAKFRALAIEQQFPGFVRACSVCFGSLKKSVNKATHRTNFHRGLPQLPLHQHLADEFQAVLVCGPDEAYFLAVGLRSGLFNVLGVVEVF